jgi:hypothetical protein
MPTPVRRLVAARPAATTPGRWRLRQRLRALPATLAVTVLVTLVTAAPGWAATSATAAATAKAKAPATAAAGAATGTTAAPAPATTAADLCPDGLAGVASWEPLQVGGNRATVAFVLAQGCRDVELTMVSYRVTRGSTNIVLDAAGGRFSAGTVNRLSVLVAGDCAYRVAFVLGRPAGVPSSGQAGPPSGGPTVIEAVAQDPDRCMFGSGPLIVSNPGDDADEDAEGDHDAAATGSTTAPTTASTATTVPTTTAPTSTRAPVAAPPATRPQPAPSTVAPAPTETTSPTQDTRRPANRLRSEPVAALGPADAVGQAEPPRGGWDATSLILLALGAMTLGLVLVRTTRGVPARKR